MRGRNSTVHFLSLKTVTHYHRAGRILWHYRGYLLFKVIYMKQMFRFCQCSYRIDYVRCASILFWKYEKNSIHNNRYKVKIEMYLLSFYGCVSVMKNFEHSEFLVSKWALGVGISLGTNWRFMSTVWLLELPCCLLFQWGQVKHSLSFFIRIHSFFKNQEILIEACCS